MYFILLVSAVYFFIHEYQENSPLALPGDAPSFYSPQTSDNLEDTLAASIRNAKSSVILITYTLRSAKIFQALNDAAQAGINVVVVYDTTASKGEVEKRLNPNVHSISRGINGIMHLKILIIDKMSTWLGSANMTRDSLKSHANLITNLHSPEFAEAVLRKANQVTGQAFEQPLPPQYFNIEGQNLELRFLPDDETALTRIKELIRSAKKTIRVAMFTFTREDLADTLIRAKNRGVDVQVVIDLGQSKSASLKIVNLLQKNDVPVLLRDTGGLMHHKFMLIDDEILEHGSANWTKNAFRQNDDYIMIIYPLIDSQKTVINGIWEALIR